MVIFSRCIFLRGACNSINCRVTCYLKRPTYHGFGSMKKHLGYIILFLFLLFISFILIRQYNLKHNFSIATARIIRVGPEKDKSGAFIVEYEFLAADGSNNSKKEYFPFFENRKQELIGKYIPCAYNKSNTKLSQLLIYKHTWQQYNLSYPDSLIWLESVVDMKKVIYSY